MNELDGFSGFGCTHMEGFSLKKYKQFAKRACKDFGYGDSVINEINAAETYNQVANALTKARLRSCQVPM